MDVEKILKRVTARAKALGVPVPAKPKDALRKSRDNGSLPNLRTLLDCAEALSTSIAYLIGETEDQSAIPQFATGEDARPMDVGKIEVRATRDGAVALIMDLGDAGTAEFLMSDSTALLLSVDAHDEARKARQSNRESAAAR